MSMIKVVARVRPLENEDEVISVCREGKKVYVQNAQNGFEYDAALGPRSSQADVFSAIGGNLLAEKVVYGKNATIMAYGQTSSGKTHTISGTETAPGLAPRLCEAIFNIIEAAKQGSEKLQVQMTVSYVEVYNEVVSDLLVIPNEENMIGIKRSGLAVRSNRAGDVKIEGLTEMHVSCKDDAIACLEVGNTNRQSAYTAANATSSRSHSIFEIKVELRRRGEARTTVGRLLVVDLAGAECADRTGFTTDNSIRRQESRSINVSLLSLGRVIFALSDKNNVGGYIPYRESTLTRLLQDSIGGSATTVLIACVSPAKISREESSSTLRYASRAMHINNANNKVHVAPPRPPDADTLARAETEADQAKKCALDAQQKMQELALEACAADLVQSAIYQATLDLDRNLAAERLEQARITLDREQAHHASSLARVIDQAALQLDRAHVEHKITTERLEHCITDANVRIKGLDAGLTDARQARHQAVLSLDRNTAILSIMNARLACAQLEKERLGFALADAEARSNRAETSVSNLLFTNAKLFDELSVARDQIANQDIVISDLHVSNADLNDQRLKSVQESIDLKTKNNDLQVQLLEVCAQVTSQESMINDLRHTKTELENQLAQAHQQVNDKDCMICDIRKEMTAKESVIDDLRSAKTDFESQLSSAHAQISSQESMINDLRCTKTELENQLAQAHQQVNDKDCMICDIRKELTAKESVIDDLRSAKTDFESQLSSAHAQITSQESVLTDLRCTKTALENQLAQACGEITSITSEFAEAQEQMIVTESELNDIRAIKSDLEIQLIDASEKLIAQKATLNYILTKRTGLECELAEAREEVTRVTSELTETDKRANAQDAEFSDLRTTNSNLKDQLIEMNDIVLEACEQSTTQDSTIADLHEEIAQAMYELKEIKEQFAAQKCTMSDLCSAKSDLEEQLTKALEQDHQARAELNEVRAQITTQNSTIAELECQLTTDASKEVKSNDVQDSTQETLIPELESTIADLRAANDLFESQVLSLTTRQSELQIELANIRKEEKQAPTTARKERESKKYDKDTEKLVTDLLAENQKKAKELAAAQKQINDLTESLQKSEAARKATLRANLDTSQKEIVAGENAVLSSRNTNVEESPKPKYALRPRRNARRAAAAAK